MGVVDTFSSLGIDFSLGNYYSLVIISRVIVIRDSLKDSSQGVLAPIMIDISLDYNLINMFDYDLKVKNLIIFIMIRGSTVDQIDSNVAFCLNLTLFISEIIKVIIEIYDSITQVFQFHFLSFCFIEVKQARGQCSQYCQNLNL